MRATQEAAFVEFVATRRDQLRRIAYGMCGDWHAADDLTQTALVKLYAAWPRVERKGREDAYVRRILLNAAIDAARRPHRRDALTDTVPDVARADPALALHDTRDALLAALQQLPAEQRAVVLLRHWLGLAVAEVAATLDLPEGTVKSHTSRGLAALRCHLESADA
ncbi:SigE family RNA polymerase sigma factor [Aeromicrobium sp.]|uniref:SigE family RNA polymerase sigma factor n=1 Tax=Aeromicrobium sp. TaxID=1871063 RepID=UPI003516E75D